MSAQESRPMGTSMMTIRSDAVLEILLFASSIVVWHATSSWDRRRGITKKEETNSSPPQTQLVRYLSNYEKWSNYGDDEETFIQELPKVELHVHLDGSFDPDYLWIFLQQNPDRIDYLPISIKDPPWDPSTDEIFIRDKVRECRTAREYHDLCTCRGRRSLTEMINAFQMFSPVVQGDLQLLEHLAYDFCQRQYEQNIVYTEVRYSPHLFVFGPVGDCNNGTDTDTTRDDPVSAEDAVRAITKGLRRGTAEYTNIVVNQILCAISWRPDWAASVVDLANRFRHDYPCAVVGVDIAAGEEHFDPTSPFHGPHVAMAQTALAHNIPMTLHAGEIPQATDDHVKRAVTEYHARRIGHGYRMTDRPETIQFIRDHNVHVEACLTSSVETGGWVCEGDARQWLAHPARSMMDEGVSLSLSSDDPAVFHTSLAWQYRTALAKMKTAPAELIRTNLDAIEAAFCSDKTKRDIKMLLVAFADERGIPGFELERSAHGLPPEQRQTLLQKQQSDTANFTDRVYLSNTEYS